MSAWPCHQIFRQLPEALQSALIENIRTQHRDTYRGAVLSLCNQKKLRPVFVTRKPAAEQVRWMAKTLSIKPSEDVVEHLLQLWLTEERTPMLNAFLDTLGISHDDEGMAENLPDTIDAGALDSAVTQLLENYPPEEVSLYLHVLQSQDPEGTWDELGKLLQQREEIALFKK